MSLKFNDAGQPLKNSPPQQDFNGPKVAQEQRRQSSTASGRRDGKRLLEAYQEKFALRPICDLKETDETSERLTIKNSGAPGSGPKLDRSNKSFLCVIDTHLRSLAKNQRESSRHNSKKSLSRSKDKDTNLRSSMRSPGPSTELLRRAANSRRGAKPDPQPLNHNTSSSSLIEDAASAQAPPQNSSLVHTIEYQAKEIMRLNDELNRYKSKYLAAKKTVKHLQLALAEADSDCRNAEVQASVQGEHCCACRLAKQIPADYALDSSKKAGAYEFFGSSLAVKKLIGASQPLERRKSTLLNLFKHSPAEQPDLNRRSSASNSYFKGPLTTVSSKPPVDPFANITKRRLGSSSLLISPPLMNTTQASNVECTNITSHNSRLQTSLQQSAVNHVRNLRKKSRNELISKLCSKDKLFR